MSTELHSELRSNPIDSAKQNTTYYAPKNIYAPLASNLQLFIVVSLPELTTITTGFRYAQFIHEKSDTYTGTNLLYGPLRRVGNLTRHNCIMTSSTRALMSLNCSTNLELNLVTVYIILT